MSTTSPPAAPPGPPPDDASSPELAAELPPRVRRVLELVYGVEGVTSARVWHWDERFAIGVKASSSVVPAELLRRVEHAVAGVREPGESWEFGLLEE